MTPEIPSVLPVLEQVPGIRAFFTTRRGGVSEGAYASLNLSYVSGDTPDNVQRNWDALLQAQGLKGKSLALPRLCHGSRAVEIEFQAPSPEKTDAVYTRDPRQILAVTMGDCLAILIADSHTRCVAAVHAGWRGSRENILGLTLDRLFNSGYCRPESTWIALGPCLSTGALEVSHEIAKSLPASHVHADISSPTQTRGEPDKQLNQNRFFFDLRGCNQEQAERAGVQSEHMTHVNACTRTDASRFFSYRRDGAASGRMAACISLI